MPIKDVYSLKGKLGDFSMQSKTPQVEGKTEPRIISVKKNWKEVIDTPEFASRKDNILVALANDSKSSTELTDVLNRVDKWMANESSIYWAISQNPNASAATKLRAADLYEKSQTSGYFDKPKSSLPLSQKSEVKYSKPDTLVQEAKKYKNFKSFVENIKELPVKILRNEDNFSTNLERWVFNKNRNRSNTVNYWEDSPFWTFDNFVKDIKENWIQTPIRVRINTDWKIVIADWTHRLLAAEELWLSSVPIEFVWKPTKSKLLLDIYNKANKSSLPMSQKSEVIYSKPVEDTLVKEARKYKSAEEFVKAIDNQWDKTLYAPQVGLKTETGKPVIIKWFHWTDKQFDKFIIPKDGVRYTGDGVYFFPDKAPAEWYVAGKKWARVVESYLALKNPYNMYLPQDNIDWQPWKERIREIMDKWHDSIIVRMKDIDSETGKVEADLINEIVVFDTDRIKSKDDIIKAFNSIKK